MTINPLSLESTLDWRTLGYNVRFWLERKEIPQGDNPFSEEKELQEHLRLLPVKHPRFKPSSHKEVLEKVVELFPTWLPNTRLNAIQVTQGDVGVVAYFVKFDEK